MIKVLREFSDLSKQVIEASRKTTHLLTINGKCLEKIKKEGNDNDEVCPPQSRE